ncbi:MAG: type IV toxin-antitoxin system AbiEi family antitoxin domain-containing protein [Thermoplasmataceae archaeon]
MKYEKTFIDYFSKQPYLTTGDAKRFLKKMGSSDEYTILFLHNLVKSGKLLRLKNGFYSFTRNEIISGFAFRPYYFGMEFALTLRKIWTQQSKPIIITTTKANVGTRNVMGTSVIVRRIDPNVFFGFEYINYSGIFVPVSVPEKILLDFLYYGINLDGDTVNALIRMSDREIIKNYADKIGKKYQNYVRMLMNGEIT